MDILEAHRQILAVQDRQRPALTIREMMDIINVSSTSYMRFLLDKMIAQGLAEKEERGETNRYHVYYLKDANE
jgi:hypothetical protein